MSWVCVFAFVTAHRCAMYWRICVCVSQFSALSLSSPSLSSFWSVYWPFSIDDTLIVLFARWCNLEHQLVYHCVFSIHLEIANRSSHKLQNVDWNAGEIWAHTPYKHITQTYTIHKHCTHTCVSFEWYH